MQLENKKGCSLIYFFLKIGLVCEKNHCHIIFAGLFFFAIRQNNFLAVL